MVPLFPQGTPLFPPGGLGAVRSDGAGPHRPHPPAEEGWQHGRVDEPRSTLQRRADALAKLRASRTDAWVATASERGAAHLVPLSFAWNGEQILLATEAASLTTRNLRAGGRARVALGT